MSTSIIYITGLLVFACHMRLLVRIWALDDAGGTFISGVGLTADDAFHRMEDQQPRIAFRLSPERKITLSSITGLVYSISKFLNYNSSVKTYTACRGRLDD